jgi:membrane-anchored protein YejM (alkaline phosphatase superfamily)
VLDPYHIAHNRALYALPVYNIDQCIDRAISKLENTNSMVNKVVMCLGTNDVSKCKDDSDQVNVLPFSWKYTTNTNQGVGKVTFDLSNILCQ